MIKTIYFALYVNNEKKLDIPRIAGSWLEQVNCKCLKGRRSKSVQQDEIEGCTLRVFQKGEENIADVAAIEEKTIRRLSIRGKIPRQTRCGCVPEGTKIQRRFGMYRSNHDDSSEDAKIETTGGGWDRNTEIRPCTKKAMRRVKDAIPR
jgi:hypothetical protein